VVKKIELGLRHTLLVWNMYWINWNWFTNPHFALLHIRCEKEQL